MSVTKFPVAMPMANTCCYCLSRGRRLVKVPQTFASEMILRNIPMYVLGDICWECTAMLKKIIGFRVRVQESQMRLHDLLQTSIIQQNLSPNLLSIQSVSNLRFSSNFTSSYPEVTVKMEREHFVEVKHDPLQVDTQAFEATVVKAEASSDDNDDDDDKDDDDKNTLQNDYLRVKPVEMEVSVEMERDEEKSDSGTSHANPSGSEKNPQQWQISIEKLIDKIVQPEAEASGNNSNNKLLVELIENPQRTVQVAKTKEQQPAQVEKTYYWEMNVGKNDSEKLSDTNPSDNETVCERRQLTHDEIMKQREGLRKLEPFCVKSYKCSPCVFWFNNQARLEAHVKKLHNPLHPVKCVVCTQSFISDEAWRLHYAEVHHWQYTCKLCGYVNSERANFNNHYNVKHKTDNKCPDCGATVGTFSELRAHRAKHRGLKSCAHCGARHPARLLPAHLRKHKKPSDQLKPCPICQKEVKEDSMRYHMRRYHQKTEEPVYCTTCDKSFKSEYHYKVHLAVTARHNPSKFECAECGKKYHKKITLAEHIMDQHLNITVQCDLCGKTVAKSRLRFHARTHKKDKRPKLKNKICQICGRGFTATKILEEHLNTHTGARPFECEQCGDTFRQSAALFTHRRLVHLGYKWKYGKKKKGVIVKPASESVVESEVSASLESEVSASLESEAGASLESEAVQLPK